MGKFQNQKSNYINEIWLILDCILIAIGTEDSNLKIAMILSRTLGYFRNNQKS